jgi:iron complex outermembrane recepter protein
MKYIFWDLLKSLKMILLLISVLNIPPLYGRYLGNITGVVRDSESSETIPNAVIHVINTDSYLTSKADGTFSISGLEEGVYQLKVTHIAYQENLIEIEVSENSNKNIRIFLIPKSIEIKPVIIRDRMYRSKFDELSEDSHVLKGRELQRELGFNLAATLRNETGLAIRSMGPAPARPVIRGLGGNRVLISEDGIEATDLSSTSPDHAVTIEPFSVTRIEVLRGPRVLLYTPVTTGGVVNVIREEIPEQVHHEIHGTAGIFGETVNSGYLGSLVAEIPFSPFAGRFEISKRNASDLNTPVGTLNNSSAQNFNYSAGGSFVSDFGYAGVSVRRFELDYGVPGGFVGAHPNGVNIEMFRDQINFKSRFNLNSKLLENIEAQFSRVLYRHKEFESSGRIGSEFRIVNLLGSVHLNHSENGLLNNGTLGASFESRDFTIGGFVFTPPTKSLKISAFIFENFNIKDFSFEFGGRYNFDKITPQYEKPNSNIGYIRERIFNTYSISFSALYSFSERIFFGSNVSKSSRVPTIEELFSEGPHLAAYSYETGNPNLSSESAFGTEFFIYHKFDKYFFNLSLFRNVITGYIIPRNSGEINFATFLPIYSTTGVDALLYGIEAQSEWNIISGFSLAASLSYTRGKFQEDNGSLPQIPPLKGNVELKYSLEDFMIGISSELAASQKLIDVFEEPTAGYTIFNSFIQYSILTGIFVHNISLSADNIFNKEYRNHLSRVKSILPEAGRNFRLTYRVYF